MTRLLTISLRYPWRVVAVASGLVLLSAAAIPRIRVELDARSLLPVDDPILKASDEAAATFHERDTLVVAFSARSGGVLSADGLEALRRLTADVGALPGIDAHGLLSLATLPRIRVDGSRLSTASRLLPSNGGAAPRDLAAVAHMKERGDPELPLLLSRDGRAAAIVAEMQPGADRFTLLDAARAMKRRWQSKGYAVYLSGSALAQAELGRATGADLAILLPVSLVVVALGLWGMLGRAVFAIVSLAEISVSLIVTLGVMGAAAETLFISTLILPVVLLVVGVCDDVYVLQRLVEVRQASPALPLPRALSDAIGSVAHTITLTTVSTVIGVGSMAIGNLTPLRVLGLYGSLAIVLSFLSAFTLIPAVLVLAGPAASAPATSSVRGRARWPATMSALALPQRPLRRLVLVGTMVLGVGVAGTRLRINDSWLANLPATGDLVAGADFIDRMFAGSMQLEIAVEGKGGDGRLSEDVFAAVRRIEQALHATPEVGAVLGPYGQVSSLLRELRGAGPAITHDWSAADARGAIALMDTIAPQAAERLWDGDQHRARITAVLRAPDYVRIDRVVAQMSDELSNLRHLRGVAGVTFFGDAWLSHRAVDSLVSSQLRSIPFAVVLDFLLFAWLFRSLRASALTIAPVVAAIAVIGAALATAGVPLGIANSMSAAITLGVGLDFSAHLMHEWLRQRRNAASPRRAATDAVAAAGPAIVQGAVTLGCGFAVLGLAASAPTRQLGLVTVLAMIACAVFTLLALPAVWLSARARGPVARGAVTSVTVPVRH